MAAVWPTAAARRTATTGPRSPSLFELPFIWWLNATAPVNGQGDEPPNTALDRVRVDSLASRIGLDVNIYRGNELVASSRPPSPTSSRSMSAGVSALILSCQPLATAFIASRLLGERLRPGQWAGVAVGLAGVTLVVWHKLDIREVSAASLVAAAFGLAGVTAATLYQRHFSPRADLRAAALIQFAVAAAAFVPLAIAVEGFAVVFSTELAVAIVFLVVFASILGVSVLNYLMRHGEAFRVASMMYLPPLFAVAAELAMFGVAPGTLALAGMAIACAGVAMTVWTPRWRSSTS